MIPNLTVNQLVALLASVFAPRAGEQELTILLDLPDDDAQDNGVWMDRRRIAAEWYLSLRGVLPRTPFGAVNFCAYPNVGTNNGELPASITIVDSSAHGDSTTGLQEVDLRGLLSRTSVVLALTEYSATAPLKVLARELGFRGATLPGFSRQMIPALLLNYEEVNARVGQIKQRMDEAERATLQFTADGRTCVVQLDLRFTGAHASGGILREAGMVGNLPSGEAYIVPYEGGHTDEPSQTDGVLPVQFGDTVVFFTIRQNRVVAVEGEGEESARQRALLEQEPAYGNIAELGIGVLGEWGVTAVGSVLLDEKLGLHVAFGRSEHFGGVTGPSAFRDKRNVVHIDWVYVPSTQPRITVDEVAFTYGDGRKELIMVGGLLTV